MIPVQWDSSTLLHPHPLSRPSFELRSKIFLSQCLENVVETGRHSNLGADFELGETRWIAVSPEGRVQSGRRVEVVPEHDTVLMKRGQRRPRRSSRRVYKPAKTPEIQIHFGGWGWGSAQDSRVSVIRSFFKRKRNSRHAVKGSEVNIFR